MQRFFNVALIKKTNRHLTSGMMRLLKKKTNCNEALMVHYERFAEEVYQKAYMITRSSSASEDLCHATFIICRQKLDTLRDEEKFLPWALKIVRNLALEYMRKERRFAQLGINDAFEYAAKDLDQVELNSELYAHLSIEDVTRALAKLPEGYQLILRLHLIEGMRHEEIAAGLGIAPSTSRSQYKRAREKLTSILIQSNQSL